MSFCLSIWYWYLDSVLNQEFFSILPAADTLPVILISFQQQPSYWYVKILQNSIFLELFNTSNHYQVRSNTFFSSNYALLLMLIKSSIEISSEFWHRLWTHLFHFVSLSLSLAACPAHSWVHFQEFLPCFLHQLLQLPPLTPIRH